MNLERNNFENSLKMLKLTQNFFVDYVFLID